MAPPTPPALVALSVPAPVVAEAAVAPDVVVLDEVIGPAAFVTLEPVDAEPVPDALLGLPLVPDESVAPTLEVAPEPSLSLGPLSEEHAGPNTIARTAKNPLSRRLRAFEHDRDSIRPR